MKAFNAAEPKEDPFTIDPDNLTQRYRDGATHKVPYKENRTRRRTSISSLKNNKSFNLLIGVDYDKDVMKFLVTVNSIT